MLERDIRARAREQSVELDAAKRRQRVHVRHHLPPLVCMAELCATRRRQMRRREVRVELGKELLRVRRERLLFLLAARRRLLAGRMLRRCHGGRSKYLFLRRGRHLFLRRWFLRLLEAHDLEQQALFDGVRLFDGQRVFSEFWSAHLGTPNCSATSAAFLPWSESHAWNNGCSVKSSLSTK